MATRYVVITPPPAGYPFQVADEVDDVALVAALRAQGVVLAPLPNPVLGPVLEQVRARLARGEAQGLVGVALFAAFSQAFNGSRSWSLPTAIMFQGQSNMAAGGRGSFGFTAITGLLHPDLLGWNGFTERFTPVVDGTANARANAGGAGTGQGPGLGQVGTALVRQVRDELARRGLPSVMRTWALAYTSQGIDYFRPGSGTLAFFEDGSQHQVHNNYNLMRSYVRQSGVVPELLVWGQGEANAGMTQAQYYTPLREIFDATQQDYPGVRWLIIGTIGGAGQRSLAAVGVARAWQIDDPAGVPSFVEETVDCNSPATADVQPWPAVEAVGDRFAVGAAERFWLLTITISTPGVGGTVVMRYWNGSSHVALPGVVDASNGFTAAAGSYVVRFAAPADWQRQALNGTEALYYVYFEVATVYSTNPVLSRVQLTVAAALGASVAGVYAAQEQLAREFPDLVRVVDMRDLSPHTALFGGFAGNHYTRRGYKLVADRCYRRLLGEGWEQVPLEPIRAHIDDLGIWTHGYSDNHSTASGDSFSWQGDLSATSPVDVATGPGHVASDSDFDGATVADFDRANAENTTVSGLGGSGTLTVHVVGRLKSLVQSQAFCELRNAGFTDRIAFYAVHQALAHAFFYDSSTHFVTAPTGPADQLVHSYALVIDPAQSKGSIYVDGRLYGEQTIDNSEAPNPMNVELGALASTDHLDARVAHVRIAVGTAATPEQVLAAHRWAATEYNLPWPG